MRTLSFSLALLLSFACTGQQREIRPPDPDLGEQSGGRDCELFDINSGSWVNENGGGRLHDRAREFERWIKKDSPVLLHGGIVYARYHDSGRSGLRDVYIGDTALHTGLYLAAEAFRLSATGAFRARKNVRKLVETIHLWFRVSGDPGNLANIAAPAGDQLLRDRTGWDCADFDRHCNVPYDGRNWDYIGDPSRDMYVGPILGLHAAYRALGPQDEAYRELIRDDLVTLAEALIRLRTIPVRFILNGAELPVRNMQTRFFVPEERDLIDGAVEIRFSTSDIEGGDIRGGQEFLPNPALLFRQLNALNWLPDIPRSGSSIMVAAFIRAAMDVSAGVPAYAARYQALADFYHRNADEWGNATTWLENAKRWSYTKECGASYFAINIAMIPMYLWALLENDPVLGPRVRDEVLRDQMWTEVETHKNSFFDFIYASTHPQAGSSVSADALDQLAGFRRPAHYGRDIDLRNRSQYSSRESGCSDQVDHSSAVDVEDRAINYFMWHSNPWELVRSGREKEEYPGHDYLVAYWMGRVHGHIGDDSAGRCLRFRP